MTVQKRLNLDTVRYKREMEKCILCMYALRTKSEIKAKKGACLMFFFRRSVFFTHKCFPFYFSFRFASFVPAENMKTWEAKKMIGNWQRSKVPHWISVGVFALCISASCYHISNDVLQINRWLTVWEHSHIPLDALCIHLFIWTVFNEEICWFCKIENFWLSLCVPFAVWLCIHYMRVETERKITSEKTMIMMMMMKTAEIIEYLCKWNLQYILKQPIKFAQRMM